MSNTMLQKLLFLFFVPSVIGSTAAPDQKWDYHSKEYGVNTWKDNFRTCTGTKQSPININNPTYTNLGKIQFIKYGVIPKNMLTAKNDGHSFSVSGFKKCYIPKIVKGGLPPGEFKLMEFHFHWGSNDSLGSEHRVNNTTFPAELHLVHTKYCSIDEGKKHPDGLAVLSVLLKQGQKNNNYNFLNLAAKVLCQDMTATIDAAFSLAGLLPTDTESFYRYKGSLTTPECQEVVTWTVFADPVEISETQLKALRGMNYCDPVNNKKIKYKLENNHRPIQKLNGRSVMVN